MHSQFSSRVTNALRQSGIPYRLLVHTRPVFTCEEAAVERAVRIDEMIKCMVFVDKATRLVVLACVPADKRVALSKLKAVSKTKSFSAVSSDDIVVLTGYERGAVSPLELPDNVVAIADTALLSKQKVNISSGLPIAGVELLAKDFRKIFRGTFCQITE